MCDFCEKDKTIFEFETLDDWTLAWGDSAITQKSAEYSKDIVFIDRGYLRYADKDDCQCMDHGENIKLNFCPFCGVNLSKDS